VTKKNDPLSQLLRAPAAPTDLAAIDTRATPGFKGGKADAENARTVDAAVLSDLQERLFAEGHTGGTRSVLLVLQGMDTAGKGGTVTHVLGEVDPQGCSIAAFGAPSKEELEHPFLWRIQKHVPRPGMIGVFDRSHYEDVGIVRVHDLVPPAEWRKRYAEINKFEKDLAARGTRVIKCFLHISREESKDRLLARLENPHKHWKFKPHDIDERAYWDQYMEAYGVAIEKCNTDAAPWYIIPADRKWYRNWAVSRLLLEHLTDMDPQWPAADFDVAEAKAHLLASD
jgi:PPK2 family polyphosphate:nucleotide phosphotransferase